MQNLQERMYAILFTFRQIWKIDFRSELDLFYQIVKKELNNYYRIGVNTYPIDLTAINFWRKIESPSIFNMGLCS